MADEDTSNYDDHFPVAIKNEGQVHIVTNYSDETARANSEAAGDFTAQSRPERTAAMVRKGQVWTPSRNADGSPGWVVGYTIVQMGNII